MHTFLLTFLCWELGWSWTGEVASGGQFVFPTHKLFFRPRQGTIILFRSAWLQHYTMPIQGEGRQLGCALYLRKQTLSQYTARQANLSKINQALNQSMRTASSNRRRGKGKRGPLEGVLLITYSDNDVQVWDENSSATEGWDE